MKQSIEKFGESKRVWDVVLQWNKVPKPPLRLLVDLAEEEGYIGPGGSWPMNPLAMTRKVRVYEQD